MKSGAETNVSVTTATASGGRRAGRWQDRVPWLLPAAVLVVGATLSAWMFLALRNNADRRQVEFFQERIAEAQAAIGVRMTTYVDALRGGTSFFGASQSVEREEWRIYAASLQLEQRYPGINGLGIIFAVTPDGTDEWLARVRTPGEPEPVIRPFPGTTAKPGDVRFLISYLEGNVTESLPIGRDVATEPSRRRAAELARDTGEPHLHHRLPGSRDTQRRSGLLLYVPLYRQGAKLETVAERRAAHLGWVYAQVFPDIFLQGVLGPMRETLRLHFFDAAQMTPERLLYASDRDGGAALPRFERVTQMTLAGQTFHLGWRRGPRFPVAEKTPAVWVASSLALATVMLAGLIASLQSVGRRANAIAVERTAELGASEERFRSSFHYSGIGMAFIGLDGRWLRVNRALCEIVGYSEADLVQKTFRDISHPADLKVESRLRDELMSGHRRYYQLEQRYLHREGHAVWVRLTASLVRGADGDVLHGVAHIEDITARKMAEDALRKSEQMFQRLFESSPDAVVLANQDGAILRANTRAEQLFGCEVGELNGKRVEQLLPERLRAGEGSYLAAYFKEPGAQPTRGGWELLGLCKDGREFPLDIMLSPVDNDGAPQTLAVIRDITERKRMEATLAQAHDEALTASRLKSEFLATMSHEIRTPMNAIIGMANLLADSSLTADQRDMLSLVQGSADNLLTIINDILDFSRIEAGKLRLDETDFELRPVFEETMALFAPRVRSPAVKLSADLAIAPGVALRGDAGRLRQILINLLSNALKFTERGEVKVEARIESQTATSVKFWVAVHDTGAGISPELRARLFQPFMQGERAVQGHTGGTGLGLAICRQLVEAMRGQIGMTSEPGRGSMFWFTLELPRARRETVPRQRYSGLRILLVEDNIDDRDLLMRELAKLDLEVHVAPDGKSAVKLLREKAQAGTPFQVTMIDWQLPGSSGLETAVAIRADGGIPAVPLILMSGGPLANPDLTTAVGFEAFLPKPVKAPDLERCLERFRLDLAPRAAATQVSGPVPVDSPKPSDHRLRLLLAEDNRANQIVCRMLLTKLGHEVDIVPDGAAALEKLATEKYDAVLMDCQMPVLDGYDATRQIRAGKVPGLDPRIPIIAVTAYAMREDRARCLEAGMDDYVSKPVRPAELRAAFGRCGLGARAPDVTADRGSAGVEVLDRRTVEAARSLPGTRGRSLWPELLHEYLAREAAALRELEERAARGDAVGLGQCAHAWAGNVSAVGGLQLRDALLALEQSARTAQWESARTHLANVRVHADRVRAALDGLKSKN